ncbi:unnamed protein product [Didymodactylos carnosus]|uniref:Uncharacterized protein n=1 Tax=Didymodactylos carnosus TaxID=1234261 RepID=A0A814K215_9BILA|nr:unnamed protein product [Didymodactylos carnosus]CAF3815209.1 unnamed protein product [Didymodactylos carnosus]
MSHHSLSAVFFLFTLFFLFKVSIASAAALLPDIVNNDDKTNETITSGTQARAASTDSSLATAVVNTQVLTIFQYQGTRVYVYSALSNENENKAEPQKWVFYYVPTMVPVIQQQQQGNKDTSSWVWSVNSEIRLALSVGTDETDELARQATIAKYSLSISQYSKYWTIAPLMIDSLMAYIVNAVSSPVQGVTPYRTVNPNSLTIIFRFECSSQSNAQLIIPKIKNGDYSIKIAFYFAGFNQVTTNFVSITAEQLKNVLSKTTADGGNTNAQYIHRNQAGKFVGKYLINVKKMMYVENSNANVTSLTDGFEEQFISLLEQGNSNVAQKIDTR